MENIFALSIGSNLGNRMLFIFRALDELRKQGEILKISSIYETEPWGVQDQEPYLNLCLLFNTPLEPMQLLNHCQDVENRNHRIREKKWQSRTLDIDLIFSNQFTLNTSQLTLPHPLMHKRKFVLLPLDEISPEWIHPLIHSNPSQLLEKSGDVTKLSFYGQIHLP